MSTSPPNSSPLPNSSSPLFAQSRLFARLKRIQNRSKNLTSFVASAAGGDLVDIPYPVLSSGTLVDANKLWDYIKTYDLNLRCFHDLPVRWFIPASGYYAKEPIAACGHRSRHERCPYWIMLDEIYSNQCSDQFLIKEYNPRCPASTSVACLQNIFPENTLLLDLDNALSSKFPTPTIQVETMPKTPVSKAATRVVRHNEKRVRGARLSIISPRSGLAGTRTRGAVAGALPSIQAPAPLASHPLVPSPISMSTLPMPPVDSAEYAAAASLNHIMPSARIPAVEPEGGYFATLLKLSQENGIPSSIFWTMFVLCRGCNHIMLGDCEEDHTCDLSLDLD